MSPTGGSLEGAWEAVERAWDDDVAHRRFIAFCSATGALAEAGRRYRELGDRDPTRRGRAQEQLGAVMGAAMLSLQNTREPPRVRRSRLWWAVCGACLAICGYAILSVLRLVAR
jgi:hypothetical protein